MAGPRILFLRGGAIGDFILTLPALSALRRRWEDAFIELVGYPHVAELARAAGLVDKVTSLDRADMARYFSMKPVLTPEQVAYVRSFDLVISYLYDPDGLVQRNLLDAGAKQVIYGSPIVKERHAIEHLMKPLEALAIYVEKDERPTLRLDARRAAEGRQRLKLPRGRIVAIHPGSGSPRKNWPLEHFLALADRLTAETECVPLLLAGEADEEIIRRLRRSRPDAAILCGCSLVELAGALAGCAGYVGNDSGVTHLAASLGLPVVALFGPSDPALWAPRGPGVHVIRGWGAAAESLSDIPVDAVFTALLGKLCECRESGRAVAAVVH